jgi:hypothetical protein
MMYLHNNSTRVTAKFLRLSIENASAKTDSFQTRYLHPHPQKNAFLRHSASLAYNFMALYVIRCTHTFVQKLRCFTNLPINKRVNRWTLNGMQFVQNSKKIGCAVYGLHIIKWRDSLWPKTRRDIITKASLSIGVEMHGWYSLKQYQNMQQSKGQRCQSQEEATLVPSNHSNGLLFSPTAKHSRIQSHSNQMHINPDVLRYGWIFYCGCLIISCAIHVTNEYHINAHE